MSAEIIEGKQRLPLPQLMERLGLGDHAKKTARCPFHRPDNTPSFSVFQHKDGKQWGWKCWAGCGSGDEINFLVKVKNIDVKEATKEFLRMAGIAPKSQAVPTQFAISPSIAGNSVDVDKGEGAQNTVAPTPYIPPPLTLLPAPLQGYVLAASESINVDPAYALLPLLSSLGSAIGNSRSILLKRNFTQPPVIWTGIIGRSGSRKSPALNAGCFAVMEHEIELCRQNRQAMEMFENDMADWEAADRKTRGPKPSLPASSTCLMDNLTLEALADSMQANPRGVLVKKDELSHWFATFDQYTNAKGADVSQWLSLHTGAFFGLDRRSDHRHYRIHQPRIALTGGIQPAVLKRTLTEDFFDRGLPARFLLANPPFKQDHWSEAEISERLQKAAAELFQGLWELRPETDEHKNEQPVLLTLDADAKAEYIAYYNECGAVSAWGDEREEAAWNKLSGYAARLALVGQLAYDPQSTVITGPVMGAACDLARWFGAEAVRIYSGLVEKPEEREQRKLIEFIEVRGGAVTVRELMQSYRPLKNQKEKAEYVLNGMAKAGLGTWVEVHREGAGRPARKFQLLKLSTSTQLTESPSVVNNSVDVDTLKSQKNEAIGRSEARQLLTDLLMQVNADVRIGLYPKGHPDCLWRKDGYPSEYAAALHQLADYKPDEERDSKVLNRLVYKIGAEEWKGTPLQSPVREWSGGGFPAEYHAAQAYLADQAKRSPFPDMTDEEWAEYDAEFRAGKWLLTDGSPDILSGHWLHFRDAADFRAFYGEERPLPETCIGLDDSDSRSELEAVQDSLSCGCKLSDEPDGFYYHPTRNVARCTDCQSAAWIAQGFEVLNGFPYGDWQATTEQRIAEQDREGRRQAEAGSACEFQKARA
jgi:hypothetical protein